MSESDDTDELIAAYRHASEAEAGRPSAATRSAILAEARRLDAQRAAPAIPAANEPRFRGRAFAGIAASVLVAGIALTLWRQTGRTLPPAQTQVQTQTAPQAPAVVAEASEAQPAFAADEQRAAQAQSEANTQRATPPAAAAAAAAAAPRAATAARAEVADTRALVQREFPQLLRAGDAQTNVWLLQDAGGRTLRTGTLAGNQSFGTVTLQLQREMPDKRIEAFEVRSLATNGGTVQVGVATAR